MRTKAREVLERPARLARALTALEERCAAGGCGRITARYGVVRTSSGGRGRGDGSLAAYADLTAAVRQRRADLLEARTAAEHLVERVAGTPGRSAARDAALLRLRYLDGRPWEAVRQALIAEGYPSGSLRTVYYWEEAAMRRANAVLRASENRNAVPPSQDGGTAYRDTASTA